MIRLVRDFRLVPVVLIATICLFALKSLGIWFDGGYTLGKLADRGDPTDITGSVTAPPPATPPAAKPPPPAPLSWAQEMFNYPDITGAVPSGPPPDKAAPKPGAKKTDAKDPPPGQGWTPVPLDNGRPQSAAERAVLERLQERRLELEKHARELEMRESLVKAAEKRIEARIGELKELEARINGAVKKKEEAEIARLKNLVTMYENMKPKEAARVFERMDVTVLLEIASQINPRRMSEILAQMSPDAAEKLTVALASRAKDKPDVKDLPKIVGAPPPS
jgi:flagellar motility protein MotE (MotC chaperone)